jgi:hypothetical protein
MGKTRIERTEHWGRPIIGALDGALHNALPETRP